VTHNILSFGPQIIFDFLLSLATTTTTTTTTITITM
jgi:hypothetical protein